MICVLCKRTPLQNAKAFAAPPNCPALRAWRDELRRAAERGRAAIGRRVARVGCTFGSGITGLSLASTVAQPRIYCILRRHHDRASCPLVASCCRTACAVAAGWSHLGLLVDAMCMGLATGKTFNEYPSQISQAPCIPCANPDASHTPPAVLSPQWKLD